MGILLLFMEAAVQIHENCDQDRSIAIPFLKVEPLFSLLWHYFNKVNKLVGFLKKNPQSWQISSRVELQAIHYTILEYYMHQYGIHATSLISAKLKLFSTELFVSFLKEPWGETFVIAFHLCLHDLQWLSPSQQHKCARLTLACITYWPSHQLTYFLLVPTPLLSTRSNHNQKKLYQSIIFKLILLFPKNSTRVE